jgi:hypothetical protein
VVVPFVRATVVAGNEGDSEVLVATTCGDGSVTTGDTLDRRWCFGGGSISGATGLGSDGHEAVPNGLLFEGNDWGTNSGADACNEKRCGLVEGFFSSTFGVGIAVFRGRAVGFLVLIEGRETCFGRFDSLFWGLFLKTPAEVAPFESLCSCRFEEVFESAEGIVEELPPR